MQSTNCLLFLSLAAAVLGCSTEKDVIVPAATDGGKPSDSDAGADPRVEAGAAPDVSRPETPGNEVGSPPGNAMPWNPADAKRIRANASAGLFGGSCGEYTVDVATKLYTSQGCAPSDTPVSRTLTAAQYAQVDADMAKLKVHTGTNCGADKPFLTVEIETSSGAKTVYWDSFYACMGGARIYVDNIDDVMTTLRNLAN